MHMTIARVALFCFCLGCSGNSRPTVDLGVKQEQSRVKDINDEKNISQFDIKKLVEQINVDNPPGRHFSTTPAVVELIARGPSVIPHVLPLMESDDPDTRIRAQEVLASVTCMSYGFRFGKGWVDPDGEARWRQWWQELGNLDADSPKEDRIRAIKLWKVWLAKHRG